LSLTHLFLSLLLSLSLRRYWDVSTAFAPDKEAQVELALPKMNVAAMQGLFFENTFAVTTDQLL